MKRRQAFDTKVLSTKIRKAVIGDEVMLLGFAAIDTLDGKPYVDLDGDQIPSDVLFDAINDYAKYSRVILYEHSGRQVGTARHTFPLTADVAESLGITSDRTGFQIGAVVDKAMEVLYDEGKINGFSIGGYLMRENDAISTLYIDETSLVETPAQEPATVDADKRGETYEGGMVEKRCTIARKSFPISEDSPMTAEERAELEAAKKAATEANEAKEAAETAKATAEEALAKSNARVTELEAKSDTDEGETVYKSLSGKVYRSPETIELAKANDELTVANRAKDVPSVPEAMAKTIIRSGDEDAIKAMEAHQKAMGTVLTTVTKAPRGEDVGLPEGAKVAEVVKNEGVPSHWAAVTADLGQREEVA